MVEGERSRDARSPGQAQPIGGHGEAGLSGLYAREGERVTQQGLLGLAQRGAASLDAEIDLARRLTDRDEPLRGHILAARSAGPVACSTERNP